MKTTTKVAIVIGALAAGRLAYDEYTIRKQKKQLEETADRRLNPYCVGLWSLRVKIIFYC